MEEIAFREHFDDVVRRDFFAFLGFQGMHGIAAIFIPDVRGELFESFIGKGLDDLVLDVAESDLVIGRFFRWGWIIQGHMEGIEGGKQVGQEAFGAVTQGPTMLLFEASTQVGRIREGFVIFIFPVIAVRFGFG